MTHVSLKSARPPPPFPFPRGLTQPGRARWPGSGPAGHSKCRQDTACTRPRPAVLWHCHTSPWGTSPGPPSLRGSSGPAGTRWHQSLPENSWTLSMYMNTWMQQNTTLTILSSMHMLVSEPVRKQLNVVNVHEHECNKVRWLYIYIYISSPTRTHWHQSLPKDTCNHNNKE